MSARIKFAVTARSSASVEAMKFPSLETLRARGTRKWTQFGEI
ncbi:hypothetical protein HMPREF0291_11125 [Corynebacterium genitalium ATCC 33030]|uniref:Uncharacterized protein n=1 Tax=Corynebacterium genitalium ATCC 33030 TaxID=585529 RepID=D7WDZ3_9CORY|nr:hypothetical protein HMPREF0291_11125 [Corynebacterium genitalium ATCC 33030]